MTRYRYAARLNSFETRPELFWPGRTDRPGTFDLIERAATARGLTAVDINYPHQARGISPAQLSERLGDLGVTLNGYAMRYNGDPNFLAGAFTNPDAAIRRKAVDLTRRGLDEAREAGGRLLTLWLGQDGVDHPFEADYARIWEYEIEGIRAVAEHDPDFAVSIEYKPNEPKAISVIPNVHATLLAIEEAGAPNLGVTLDFAHVLYGDSSPALAAALVGRRSRMLGLHLNDGYGKRDDGLMVGSVHTVQTIELLRQLVRDGFAGTIYFDTFPDGSGLDPVAETEANVAVIEAMFRVIDRLPEADLDAALTAGDALTAHRLVQRAILGLDG
jgi:xylose isomerase